MGQSLQFVGYFADLEVGNPVKVMLVTARPRAAASEKITRWGNGGLHANDHEVPNSFWPAASCPATLPVGYCRLR